MTTIRLSPLTASDRRAAAALNGAPAEDIVAWACDRFGRQLCLTTSFTDTVLVHLATQVLPDIEVVFLDTGFHFAETLDTMKRAHARYRLNLTVARPDGRSADVWADGAEACCGARKVDLVDRLMAGRFDAWISGLRRSDSQLRAAAEVVEVDRNGRVKVNPLVHWSDADVARYVAAHGLIENPLTHQGYPSVGCWPCTTPVDVGHDSRSGRWSGTGKTECGLHR